MVITNIRVCPVPLYSAWGFSAYSAVVQLRIKNCIYSFIFEDINNYHHADPRIILTNLLHSGHWYLASVGNMVSGRGKMVVRLNKLVQ